MTTPATIKPESWQDWSAYRFLAPDKKAMMGRLMVAQLPSIRGQMSITFIDVAEDASLAELVAERPLPMGVTHISTSGITGTPPQVRRVYWFTDPLRGWLIQQSQTFLKDGGRLYTILLTADPLTFASAEQDAKKSGRVVQLADLGAL